MLRILDEVFIITPELTVEKAVFYVETFDAFDVGRRIYLVETPNRQIHKVPPECIFENEQKATIEAYHRSEIAIQKCFRDFRHACGMRRMHREFLAIKKTTSEPTAPAFSMKPHTPDPEAVQIGEIPTTDDPSKTKIIDRPMIPAENKPTDVSEMPF